MIKNNKLGLKAAFILLISLSTGSKLVSQTQEQTRSFVNKTHIAIMKVEKEMYKAGDKSNATELRQAMKHQVIALNLFKENKFKDALGNSLKSRNICIELCDKMGISEGSWYNLNDDEKVYCKPSNYTNLTLQPALLKTAQNTEIETIDVLDVQKFQQLDLNIK